MKPMVCQVCGDDVVFGQLLPTGAVCVDCGGVATMEPKAPTNNPHDKGEGASSAPSPAPRAAEEQEESKGAFASGAGDRADQGLGEGDVLEFEVADLRTFDAPRRSEQLSIDVEEWIYGIDSKLLRTPREVFLDRIRRNVDGFEASRFVVVLEHRLPDSDVTLRDIGASFTPRTASREDRAAALNTASGWARNQATRLKADPPRGYRSAREV